MAVSERIKATEMGEGKEVYRIKPTKKGIIRIIRKLKDAAWKEISNKSDKDMMYYNMGLHAAYDVALDLLERGI